MIKSITVINYLNESMKLELTRPEESGFIVKPITGLGPVKATINTSEVSTMDGALYNSSRLDKRNIVLNLQFLQSGAETIEDIRQRSYKFFPPKRNVRLIIETDNRTVETEGCVEDNTPDIFSKNEGCTVSILCPDPYLYSQEDSKTVFSGVEPRFTFPFSNESLTEPMLIMGVLLNKTEQVVIYKGEADVGMLIYIHAMGEATNLTIVNTTTGEKMKINTGRIPGGSIIKGDTIIIDTRIGNKKRLALLRDGKQTNILNCLERGFKWFTLTKGNNIFAYTAETGSDNLQFSIMNKVAYIGV